MTADTVHREPPALTFATFHVHGRRPLPCGTEDPDLWFAENPAEVERAKRLCAGCPVRLRCLAMALRRGEPWGVWGGELLDNGRMVSHKRGPGRPRKSDATRRGTA